MGGIYGKYHRMITSQELESPQYNGWLNNTAFIFGEEIATNATKYNVTPYLNALITAKSVTINEKHRPQNKSLHISIWLLPLTKISHFH